MTLSTDILPHFKDVEPLLIQDPKKALELLEEISKHPLMEQSKDFKAHFLITQAKGYMQSDDVNTALQILEKGWEIDDIHPYYLNQFMMFKGFLLTYAYKIEDAKVYLNESIEFFSKEQHLELLTEAQSYLGVAYLKESNFTDAITTLMNSIDMAMKLDLPTIEAKACSYIGIIHLWLKNTLESTKWLDRSLDISKKNNLSRMVATNQINAASIDLMDKNPKKSITRLKEALKYLELSTSVNNHTHAIIYNNLGNAYMDDEVLNIPEALDCHYEALIIGESIASKNSICHALWGISNVMFKKDLYEYPVNLLIGHGWFEEKLGKAREIVKNNNDLMLNQTTWHAHTNYYKVTHQYEKALFYLEKLMTFKERHIEKEKNDSVKTLQIQYDLQQKELELQKLELKQKKELEIINKTLEKKVEERTKNIITQNKELEEYAYIVAHDLKEPIRSIVSFTQLLERKIKGKIDEEEKELLNFIRESGMNMGNLVNALLKYSTVKIDYEELPTENMNDILDEVMTIISFSVQESGADIRTRLLPESVKCDRTKIKQLFQNLISNAIKFRKKDTDLVIEINCTDKGDFHIFNVSDNGIGIDAEYHSKIFKMFKRLHKNDNYEGTGIGLSISKKIIDQHHGEIWLESAKDEGTTFYFSLPKH